MQFFIGLAIGLAYGMYLSWMQAEHAEWLAQENQRLWLVAKLQRKATDRIKAQGRASFDRTYQPSRN